MSEGNADTGADPADREWALRLTRRARTDIEAARDSLAERVGDALADAWLEGLEGAIASLSRLPERCPAAREADLFPPSTVHQLVYRKTRNGPAYRVLFRLYDLPDDAPFVRLLALRHGAQAPMTADEAQPIEDADDSLHQ